MTAKTMTGARAQLSITNPNAGTAKIIGIFSNVSWGLALDVQPVYVLGRYTAAETVYTGQETVSVSGTGYKQIDQGAHKAGGVPTTDQLMEHEYLKLDLYDRLTGRKTASISHVRPTGYSTSLNARGVQEISMNFIGIMVEEDELTNSESGGGAMAPTPMFSDN